MPSQGHQGTNGSKFDNGFAPLALVPEQNIIIADIDHDALQAIFGLSDAKLELAKQVLHQSNIFASMVYGMLLLKPGGTAVKLHLQRLNKSVDILDFIFRKMLEAKLVAYSCQNNADGSPEPLALINLTQAHVSSLLIEIKKQHFPAGFSQGNIHAQWSVLGMVWSLLKHDQVTLCNLLLKNFADTSLGRIRGAAPCLEVLYNKVHHFCFIFFFCIPFHCGIACSSGKLEPNPHVGPPLIINSNCLVQNLTNISGSEHLSSLYDNYIWAEMIIEKDKQIFGPVGAIYASVQNIPHLTTPEEVDNAVELCTREFLSTTNKNGLNDEGSTLALSSNS
ncbi:hypothetical protein VP01_453g8 [Puccinia sorghi]|uniref:Uncharacterized protein n=1 Tax=Puccinia sorghi TaxID=27349 RepID=A0A0L6UNV8_9BASI|nr:hypothetical protein VP01_453g8 [Puccinia sorghi]